MDPNETLKTLRAVATRIDAAGSRGETPSPEDAVLLAEHFHALDLWVVNGGFLPQAWQQEGKK